MSDICKTCVEAATTETHCVAHCRCSTCQALLRDMTVEKVLQAFRKVDAELDARGLAALRPRLEAVRRSYLSRCGDVELP
jgi:pyrimidine deaminase RibD-like protein